MQSVISEQERQLSKFVEAGVDLNIGLKDAQENIQPRTFKGNDLADALGITRSTLSRAETTGRISFDKDDKGRRLGVSYEEMMEMQEVFGSSPRCRGDERGVVISVQSLKGGSWKSSNCHFMGTYYASLGLRVCLIDLDPQASLSLNVGKLPDIEVRPEHTMLHHILDESDGDIFDVVQDTHIPNMKIIPSCLQMAQIEIRLTSELTDASTADDSEAKLNLMTRVHQTVDPLRDNFDIIIIDGTPSINLLAMNVVFASDACIIPCATESTDYAATISFCSMLKEQLGIFRESLGEGLTKLFPEFRILPTRFTAGVSSSASREILDEMHETFGDSCLNNYIKKHDSVVSNLSLIRRTVFDTNGGTIKTGNKDMDIKIPSKARKSAIENFSAAYDEILEKLVLPCWPNRMDTMSKLRGK